MFNIGDTVEICHPNEVGISSDKYYLYAFVPEMEKYAGNCCEVTSRSSDWYFLSDNTFAWHEKFLRKLKSLPTIEEDEFMNMLNGG